MRGHAGEMLFDRMISFVKMVTVSLLNNFSRIMIDYSMSSLRYFCSVKKSTAQSTKQPSFASCKREGILHVFLCIRVTHNSTSSCPLFLYENFNTRVPEVYYECNQ